MNASVQTQYRKDIDGLRAFAVIAVIAFHFGILPNGFLGVDVFFVISGYLITRIITTELGSGTFSIVRFYVRRTRRILPLTLTVGLLSLLIGLAVMLPDDLENLAQSVVATNFFANNILQAETTKNYWDVVNEYKPLMHTWSLGIEEQFYIIYPLLLVLFYNYCKRLLFPAIIFFLFTSLYIYYKSFDHAFVFYYLPSRFFELAGGGLSALIFKGKLQTYRFAFLPICLLVAFFFLDSKVTLGHHLVPITVILTMGVIISNNSGNLISSFILENRLAVAIGLSSFSLYMWHQVVLAYLRYFVFQSEQISFYLSASLAIGLLSMFSFYFIERPFRNEKVISNFMLASTLLLSFIVTTILSLYIYSVGGVLRDVPELGIKRTEATRGIHATYNHRIKKYDRSFSEELGKIKVLVAGNSFARDWANVLLESEYKESIDLSYRPYLDSEFVKRAAIAQIVFLSEATIQEVEHLEIVSKNLYIIGTKNFGINNGYFYNSRSPDYFGQRTHMEAGYFEKNELLKSDWGNKYIDLIGLVLDENGTVPVFTPEHLFISQDCRHFTKSGAIYFAKLLEHNLSKIFQNLSFEHYSPRSDVSNDKMSSSCR